MAAGKHSPHETEALCGRIKRETVERVVHEFYVKLRQHPQLGRFFSHIENFDEHEAHIAVFWWWSMGGRAERKRPFDMTGRHRPLGLDEQAFQQWLALFYETMLEHLPQQLADEWVQLAQRISVNLRRMIGLSE